MAIPRVPTQTPLTDERGNLSRPWTLFLEKVGDASAALATLNTLAPNLGAATASAIIDPGNQYHFEGTVTLPTTDPNFSHLKAIHIIAIGPSPLLTEREIAVLRAPFAVTTWHTDSWDQQGVTSTWTIEFRVENETGQITPHAFAIAGIVLSAIPLPTVPAGVTAVVSYDGATFTVAGTATVSSVNDVSVDRYEYWLIGPYSSPAYAERLFASFPSPGVPWLLPYQSKPFARNLAAIETYAVHLRTRLVTGGYLPTDAISANFNVLTVNNTTQVTSYTAVRHAPVEYTAAGQETYGVVLGWTNANPTNPQDFDHTEITIGDPAVSSDLHTLLTQTKLHWPAGVGQIFTGDYGSGMWIVPDGGWTRRITWWTVNASGQRVAGAPFLDLLITPQHVTDSGLLLDNGGFEKDFQGWAETGAAAIETGVHTPPLTGLKCLRLAGVGSVVQFVQVRKGETYRIECDVYTEPGTGGAGALSVVSVDASFAPFGSPTVIAFPAYTGAWQTIGISYNPNLGASYISVTVLASAWSAGAWDVDNVTCGRISDGYGYFGSVGSGPTHEGALQLTTEANGNFISAHPLSGILQMSGAPGSILTINSATGHLQISFGFGLKIDLDGPNSRITLQNGALSAVLDGNAQTLSINGLAVVGIRRVGPGLTTDVTDVALRFNLLVQALQFHGLIS